MNSRTIFTLLLIFFFSTAFIQRNSSKIASKDLQEDFKILRNHLKQVHAGLYNYHTPEEFEQIFDKYKFELNHDLTPVAFYQKIGTLIKDIGDVHTDMEPPEIFYDSLNNHWNVFPVSIYWLNEKLYTIDDFSDEQVIQPGDQIISINGLPAGEIFKKIRAYVPRDGFNLTSPNNILSGTFGQFRNYYTFIYGHPEKFDLRIKDSKQIEKNIQINGLKYKTIFDKYKQRNKANEKVKPLRLEFKESVAILTVQSFHPQQIKDARQKYKQFFKQAFKKINNKKIEKLVVDVRGNGGGHESVFIELFSYLTDENFVAYRQLHTITNQLPNPEFYLEQNKVAYLEKWARKKLTKQGSIYLIKDGIGTKVIKPKKNPYLGKLYILIDGKSSSATGDFSGLVKGMDRAIFIGEETGGNPYVNTAGTRFTLVLPHSGLQIYIPTLLYTINNKGENTGHGVIPDIPIELMIDDIINKNDKAMEYVLSKE